MISEILNATAKKIISAIGESEIHLGELKQGFKEPCFYIHLLDVYYTHVVGDRYQLLIPLNIEYHSDEKNSAKKAYACSNLFEKLTLALEYIEPKDMGMIRGQDMHSNIEDGVMHFMVDYKIFIRKKDIREIPVMQKLILTIQPKGVSHG